MTFVAKGELGSRVGNHTSQVVEQLGRAIVAGEYPPETMIPLDPDISEMFNVSRTVVREAKKTLIGKGLIQSKAKVGTHVRPAEQWNMFDPDVLRWHASLRNVGVFMDELFEIRLIFEPAAAGKAAACANEADCAALSELCENLAKGPDRAAVAVADLEFHKMVLNLSGNRFLQSLGDLVQAALYSLFIEEARERSDSETDAFLDRHRAVVKAIATGAPEEASAAMRTVILAGRRAPAG
ncbi:FadR family transcriptional regulator [Roseibium sp. CAU 1637]|uniref:FadR family transcriptional regulator n=1 Tax=Roseibium limicola TaxID=2816037 RepID=A0A939J7G7_9HYPH|nr:FadR/GntR family transcriptional regulator [Roseibium limicola]MBO0344211.1 FadR family transcriptional regulator [Roseibium limicola]